MMKLVAVYNYIGFRLLAPPFALSQSAVGAIYVVYLVGSAASAIMGRLADRYGRRNVLSISETIFIAGVLVTLAGHLAEPSSPAWRFSRSGFSARTRSRAATR